MRAELRKRFLWVNEQRERRGFRPLSRREFVKLAAKASAGASLSLVFACGGKGENTEGGTENGGTPGGSAGAGSGPGGTGGPAEGTGGATGGSGGATAGSGGTTGGSGGTVAGSGGTPAGSGGTTAGSGGTAAGSGGAPAGSGGGPAGSGGGPAGSGGGPAGSGGEGGSGGSPPPPGVTAVGISRNSDIITNVRDAIELAGGLGDIQQGDRVIIKPNLVAWVTDAFTHPEVLRGVIQAVKERTAANNITLAECTALGMSTTMWAEPAGYLALCQEEGINPFVAWEELPYVGYRDPKWQFIKEEKRVPQMLDPSNPQYEHFITVPKLKNHQLCPYSSVVFTSCIKLFVGVVAFDAPGGRWTPPNPDGSGRDGLHDEFLGEQCAELHCVVPEKVMNVIDATTCVPGNGPSGTGADTYFTEADTQLGGMAVAPSGLVIASKDIAAADSVGLAVLKHYAKELTATTHPELATNPGVTRYVDRSVWEDAQIKRAGELGIGVADPSKIEIRDKDVDNIQAILADWS